jgi:hypothetical protein
MAGIVVSEFFGLNHVEGPLPPLAVYGTSGAVVLWILVGAAIVTAVPMAMAMVADDPRRNLRIWALIMALGGMAILPDPLGRAFGLPLLGGAVCLLVGGELVHRAAVATESATGQQPAPKVPRTDAAPTAPVAPTASSPEAAPADTAAPSHASPSPAGGRGRGTSSRTPKAAERMCPWCSTSAPAAAESCPNCGATLDAPAANEVAIPGLTVVPPELQRYADSTRDRKKRTDLLGLIFREQTVPTDTDTPEPSDPAALRPPDPALKAEMARLDEEIAAGIVPIDEDPAATPPESAAESAPAAVGSTETQHKPRGRKPRNQAGAPPQ